jgi:2-dehydro-3-deoxygalactonokinase
MSDAAAGAALIALDWGTTHCRAMALGADGGLLAERHSEEGIGRLDGGHEAAFERIVAGWPAVPALMAGMIGSQQGWRQAPYVACPAGADDIAAAVLSFRTAAGRPAAIVPGLVLHDPVRSGDVIRGEETQMLGLLESEAGFSGLVIHPGTHSKWASLAGGRVVDFQTFLSGELFELLSTRSFLRHSVEPSASDPCETAGFRLAVERTARDGLPFLAGIFSVRVRQLLENAGKADNLGYLSGLVVGGEIAAARALGRLQEATRARIIGSRSLGRTYHKAFELLGLEIATRDGGELVRAGLVAIARRIGLLAGSAA